MHTQVGQHAAVLSWYVQGTTDVSIGADTLVLERAVRVRVSYGSHDGKVHFDVQRPLDMARHVTLTAMELATLPSSVPLSYDVRVELVLVHKSNHSSTGISTWTPWSATRTWFVGPAAELHAWPAGAGWICTSPSGSTDSRSSLLRREFKIPAGRTVTSAVVHAVGLGVFRLHVNGVDIMSGEHTTPGQTDWRKRVLYSTYALPSGLLIAGGSNAVAATIGNGMYNVPNVAGRYTKWSGSFGPRMVLLTLIAILDDGSNVTVASNATAAGDDQWLATDGGPITFSHEYGGEDFHASLQTPGWDSPGFNSSSNPLVPWTPARDCAAAYPGGSLLPTGFEPVAVVRSLPAINMTASTPAGTLLIDVGKNFAGSAKIEITGVPHKTHFVSATAMLWKEVSTN